MKVAGVELSRRDFTRSASVGFMPLFMMVMQAVFHAHGVDRLIDVAIGVGIGLVTALGFLALTVVHRRP